MKLNWIVEIVFLNLAINCVFTGRIIQCKPPAVINAVIACSTDPLPNGNYVNLARCSIFCKDGHVQSSGPSTIDCYRGYWLHGGDDHVPYKTPTECKSKLPTAVGSRPMAFGRSLRLGFTLETKHEGICSNSHCDRRYSGITKRVCLKFKCCWNEEKRDCYEHLQDECQISKAKRSRCVGTWKGISEKQCVRKKCCFDSVIRECYSYPFKTCRASESNQPRCPGTWKGITKTTCLRRNCCYDAKNSYCYIGLKDKSQIPLIAENVTKPRPEQTTTQPITRTTSTEAITQSAPEEITTQISTINITAKSCDFKIDLSTGKLSYSDEITKTFITVLEKSKPPMRSNSVSSVRGHCDYQSLLEIQYDKIKAFEIYIKYDVPSGYNFHITSKENATADGESLWVSNYHLKGTPDIPRQTMIAPESSVKFQINKTSDEVIFKVGKTKQAPLPINFNSASTIKVGLNRGVFLSNPFDIWKMGSGVCSLCVKYS